MALVSIIIPVHNAGSRLKECLDSLVNQTLKDIEIICVLDKPTDGSIDIVRAFAATDNRIIVVENIQNEHIAESRNKGLRVAKGEYIGFSDHDDCRSLDMYELLYSEAKNNDADIVFSNSYVNYATEKELVKYEDPTSEGVIRSIILPMHIKKNVNKLSKSIWASIYRKSFIDKNSLSFKDRRIYYEEDTLFNLKAFLLTEKIAFCNKVFYTWNKFIESESSKPIGDIACKQLNFLKVMIDILLETSKFDKYNVELKILISDWIWRKENYESYRNLSKVEKKSLLKLLMIAKVPLLGKSDETKILSRKRLRFFFLFLSLFINKIFK